MAYPSGHIKKIPICYLGSQMGGSQWFSRFFLAWRCLDVLIFMEAGWEVDILSMKLEVFWDPPPDHTHIHTLHSN